MTSRWVNPINNNILHDLQNNVLASGSVAFYEAGTSTPLAVYSDPELTVSLGSYIDADPYGLLPDFHMAAGTQYKMVAYDAIGGAGGAGAVEWTRNDVFSADSSVDTRLDALESSIASIEVNNNYLVNGGMRAASSSAVTITTSYLEGQVTGLFGKVSNVTAGTMIQEQDDDYQAGYTAKFSGVSTNNAAATVDAQFRIESKDCFQFMNGDGVFSCWVEHDVGSAVNYTVTVSVANAVDDFSAIATILASSATAVATGTRTKLTFPVDGLGDVSNGIAITISAAVGVVTTKNLKIGDAQFELGLVATDFYQYPYAIVEASTALDQALQSVQDAVNEIQSAGLVWTSPTLLGSSLSILGIAFCAVAGMTDNEIALYDPSGGGLGELRWYRFNGSAWAEVGTGLVRTGGLVKPTITRLSASRVALFDSGNQQLGAYDWSGSSWSLVGSLLSISASQSAIAALTSSVIVKATWTGSCTLQAYSFNGSTWSTTGNPLVIASAGSSHAGLCAINSTDVAYLDGTSKELRVYRFDGTDFAQVGNSTDVSPASAEVSLTSMGGNDVCVFDPTDNIMTMYRFDGTDWAKSGFSFALNGSSAGFSSFNGTDVAWIEPAVAELRAYRWGFQLGSGPFRA